MTEEIIVKKLLATLEKDTRINLHRYPISIAMQNADLILAGEMESGAAKKSLSWRPRKLLVFTKSSTG